MVRHDAGLFGFCKAKFIVRVQLVDVSHLSGGAAFHVTDKPH